MNKLALILAAGQSRRMGHPKQLIAHRGRPLVHQAARVAQRAGLSPLVILGARAAQVAAALPPAVPRLVHEGWARGMGSTLAFAIEAAARRQADLAVVTLCDQPQITPEDLVRLVQGCQRPGREAAAAWYEGALGAPAAFRACCFARLRSIHPARGARSLLRGGAFEVEAVPMASAALDLDTPEAVRRWRASTNRGSA
jgi:molybdenum cofactor cytidylyltransferase